MKALLAHPAYDVNKTVQTTCWGALYYAMDYFYNDMAKLLIDSPRIDVNAVDKFGRSLLQVAVERERMEVLK